MSTTSTPTAQANNPTLKGRLLNLQRQAKNLKVTLNNNQTQIKSMVAQIEEGTQAKILEDKIAFIKDYLTEKLDRIDYKMYVWIILERKKHLQEQKEKNNQLIDLIGIVKGQKNQLQRHLAILQERVESLNEKIGDAQNGTGV